MNYDFLLLKSRIRSCMGSKTWMTYGLKRINHSRYIVTMYVFLPLRASRLETFAIGREPNGASLALLGAKGIATRLSLSDSLDR